MRKQCRNWVKQSASVVSSPIRTNSNNHKLSSQSCLIMMEMLPLTIFSLSYHDVPFLETRRCLNIQSLISVHAGLAFKHLSSHRLFFSAKAFVCILCRFEHVWWRYTGFLQFMARVVRWWCHDFYSTLFYFCPQPRLSAIPKLGSTDDNSEP